jgi:transposase
MVAIGIDTHKATLAACAVDVLGVAMSERTFTNNAAGHAALATWASNAAPGATIGVEGSSSFGAPIARLLVARGFAVREVPPQLSRRERSRTRRAGKSDPGDALAIARVTAADSNLPPVRLTDRTTDIALLVEAREDLVAEMTRVRNRLHADLCVLAPGYGETAANLVAVRHQQIVAHILRRMRGVHAELARVRLARLRQLGHEEHELVERLSELVAGHPLLRLPGAGPLTTAKLVAETGDVTRFRSADAFAALAGVAPIPASSGQTSRMRLNRGGNRQLNRALYSIALSQAFHHEPAQKYIARKRAEGKSWREAIRCLKRQLIRTVFSLLLEGAKSHQLAA